MPTRTRKANSRPRLSFDRKLILNQWLLGLFGVERFDQFAEFLRAEELEGLDDNNVHRFYHEIRLHLDAEKRPELPDDLLLEYDQGIVAITQRLNECRITRGEPRIVWKYFQYLALLSTEIYLDRYFRAPQALLATLNERIAAFNEGAEESAHIVPLDDAANAEQQLNKIAFWMATGSGKTLLMHAHILQYLRFLEVHDRTREMNRIILLTPNPGLSQQHLREFEKAGIEAEIFNKDSLELFSGRAVEILEVTKLKEQMGDKTVAVDAFEGNNLVLVDEGHRGASAGGEGAWMEYRQRLCEKGFSFEYSATFGQAVKNDSGLTNLYARSTLFDYSYRWFYRDGFGKDYQILNLEADSSAEWMASYLTACLLAFFQQQRLFREQGADFRPFNIERPLWIFVGGSVTATLATRDASDIVEILRFLSGYVANRTQSIAHITRVLQEELVTATGKNLFAGRFNYLNTTGLTPAQIFDESLALLFNAPAGGALHVENLKGVTGEVALRVGENEPFGVINVGDDAKLVKLCAESGLNTGDRELRGSLFQAIQQPDSTINVLIGSKKFTEGWSSWRVSTMGLMNMGKSEGAQIIQLFGRGVRLKGYEMSLKRSDKAKLPAELKRPKHLEILETLNIFGVRANYMAQFRDFLNEEDLPDNDQRIKVILPIKVKDLKRQLLKTIRLKKEINGISTELGDPFSKLGPIPTILSPDSAQDRATEYLQKNQVVLNWYPKIQAMTSEGVARADDGEKPNHESFTAQHLAFLDIDRLYFDLERFKAERGWYNLNITRNAISELLTDKTWYQLLIPESSWTFDSFDNVRVWQEVALALLKRYTERYFSFRKREWELPHLEYRDMTADDANFRSLVREDGPEYGYRILIHQSREDIVTKLNELKEAIEVGELKPLKFAGIEAIWFCRHLYQPLLFVDSGVVEVSPAPLNKGERRFVDDLKKFCDANSTFLAERELYLLRNQSRGRGVGFFEAGNFHPDFILWQLVGDRQHVSFVDPKGIRNLEGGFNDRKIMFFETVKEIQERLGDPKVTLDSFVVSNTPFHVMEKQWSVDKTSMNARHILFQDKDEDTYIRTLLSVLV